MINNLNVKFLLVVFLLFFYDVLMYNENWRSIKIKRKMRKNRYN